MMQDAATLNLDALGFDALMADHYDTSRDAERARDVLTPLLWPEWVIWQAWAVCGVVADARQGKTLFLARKKLLDGVKALDLTAPKADLSVPVLREHDLLLALDEDELLLWTSYYIGGRSDRYLAARRGCSPRSIHHRLARIRPVVEVLLPPDTVGPDIANGQCRLTLCTEVL